MCKYAIPFANIVTFRKICTQMRLHTHIIILLAIFLSVLTYGAPARRGHMTLVQPDGTSFTARFKGDEFTRIKTTVEGHAITQDNEGWWCYAEYDNEGNRTCTGWRVGHPVPADIKAVSMAIPYRILSERAAALRAEMADMGPVRTPIWETITRMSTKASVKTKHGIVILAEFQDVRFSHTREDFEVLLSQAGYRRNGSTGSAKDYFDEQFAGVLEFEFDVIGPVTLSRRREHYGGNGNDGNDLRPEDLVIEACRHADSHLDFSVYDDNSDGIVDNVFVFFAGEDEAEGGDEECLWSHAWYLKSGAGRNLTLDGCQIDRYACSAELTRIYNDTGQFEETRISGIGTFCHEYCHTLGLPDMYDTDYDADGGWAAGLWGSTSVMDAGNQNNHGNTPPNLNAIERDYLGITVPSIIRTDGTYCMNPIDMAGECFRLETDENDEYYLLECRSTDRKWDAYIGGSGMLVYHVDRTDSMTDRWETLNKVNAEASHQCADLVEADGRRDCFSGIEDFTSSKGNTQGLFFPYDNVTSLPLSGTPGLNFWSGEKGHLYITDIRMTGDGAMEFQVASESEQAAPPSVRNTVGCDVFCDGAIITFESSREHDGDATVTYGLDGQEMTTLTVKPYKAGKYAVLLEGLHPASAYTVTMSFSVEGVQGKTRTQAFTTKRETSLKCPHMNFGNAKKNMNGTFLHDSRIPLKLINARDAVKIRWTFNDEDIQTEGDHYYSLRKSGVLKAYVTWEDGSEDVVVKEIIISPLSVQ